MGERRIQHVRCLLCNAYFFRILSHLQTLPCSRMVLGPPFLAIHSFLSSKVGWLLSGSIKLCIQVIVFVEVLQRRLPRLAILIMKFSCLGDGVAMLTSCTLMFPTLAFSISHLVSIWPLLLLQFPILRLSLSRPFWLELGLSHFREEVMRKSFGDKNIKFLIPFHDSRTNH